MSALLIELLQASLHRSDVADDAILWQQRQQLLEDGNGVLQRDGIDEKLRLKLAYLLGIGKPLTVVGEAHALWVAVVDSHFVFETQQVDEERAHLSCSNNQYFHNNKSYASSTF